MFSELCRETLRKAAVCYSSGRAGSPSPSPPTSPPASPSKEAKTPANTDLGNVRGTGCECRDSSATGRRHTTQPVELRDLREYVYALSLRRTSEPLNPIVDPVVNPIVTDYYRSRCYRSDS
ncbi:hypothetical protein HZH68_003228 [Vespula germanica]|uniref:Uncharacterized protein n=1 Tax=Vespula germanica TaxID=30212 RepID=A0A834NNR8_VESGE|nr:hypothetical protein HZH68_003228 [Vespula germanica]